MIGATLFSGIGAPETAMPEWRWAWSAEIEKFPCAVLQQRHYDSINLGNVTSHGFIDKAGYVAIPDVLVFGSPCQSYSIAGKRLGLDDPRGNLALVALGIIARLKPRWFVFENVPGLLSSSEGRDFGLFLRAVDELRYFGAWAGLDAQYRGLAQRRDRLFFVGNSRDWRDSAAVLFEPESLCGDSAPRRQAGQRIGPTLAARTSAGGGLGTDFDCDGGLIARSLNAHPSRSDGESETFVTHALRADGFDASEDGIGRGTPLIASPLCAGYAKGAGHNDGKRGSPQNLVMAFSCKDHGADAATLAPTLRAMGHDGSHANGGGQVAIAFQTSQSGVRGTEAHATLDANNGSRRHNGAVIGSAVRRLTPRECERLQGFPDDYTAISYRGKPAADGPRYKALGNSMAVPIMRWILSRIEAVHAFPVN
jgi:DNA (cytosine-5)-methyltransferase 1